MTCVQIASRSSAMLRMARFSLPCKSFKSTASAVSNETPSHLMQVIRARVEEAITSGVTCRVNDRWMAGSTSRALMRVAALLMAEVPCRVAALQSQRSAGWPAPEASIAVPTARVEPGEQKPELVRVVSTQQSTGEVDWDRHEAVKEAAAEDEQDRGKHHVQTKRFHRDPEDHGGPGACEKQGVLGEALVGHGMIVGEGEGGSSKQRLFASQRADDFRGAEQDSDAHDDEARASKVEVAE